ncbi:MAG: hypothetical protein H0T89_32455, partial [Deltaproteobacteria bacterium]|nr:hypothetical protein [Deltaproteobacteria bacterium]
ACRAVADDAVAVFYQTDVKHDGRWIDKGHLVLCGAEAAGSHALFHKIVCRVPAGMTTFGRPAYAHLVCVSRERRLAPGASTPDVLQGRCRGEATARAGTVLAVGLSSERSCSPTSGDAL